jgi:hypothetical protein
MTLPAPTRPAAAAEHHTSMSTVRRFIGSDGKSEGAVERPDLSGPPLFYDPIADRSLARRAEARGLLALIYARVGQLVTDERQ